MSDSKMTTEVHVGHRVSDIGAAPEAVIEGIEPGRNRGLRLRTVTGIPQGAPQTIPGDFEVLSLGDAKYREHLEPFIGEVTNVREIHEAVKAALGKKTMLFLKKNYIVASPGE